MPQFPERLTDNVTADYAWSVVLIIIFVGAPLLMYSADRDILGVHAELTLFAIGTLGMGVAFSVFFGAGQRLLAFVPGLVTGATAIALYLYAPFLYSTLNGFMSDRLAFGVASLIALLPGLFLYWILRKLRGQSDAKGQS